MPPGPQPHPYAHRIDLHELDRAWRTVRSVADQLDRVAREEGWPTPFGPVRYLILATLDGATAYGLSARRLARSLGLHPSTIAHHIGALEGAGLVLRTPWTVHDRRKVAVRLTDAGRYAVPRLRGQQPAVPAEDPVQPGL